MGESNDQLKKVIVLGPFRIVQRRIYSGVHSLHLKQLAPDRITYGVLFARWVCLVISDARR